MCGCSDLIKALEELVDKNGQRREGAGQTVKATDAERTRMKTTKATVLTRHVSGAELGGSSWRACVLQHLGTKNSSVR